MNSYKIGFIGIGKMGQAIAHGLISHNIFAKENIFFYDTNKSQIDSINKSLKITFLPLADLVSTIDILLIAVKPQNIDELLKQFPEIELKSKLIISILAGTKIQKFESLLGESTQIIRVMPNTPILLKHGMCAISYNKNVTEEYKQIAKLIFQNLSEIEELEETLLDAVTGISGSGPAFIYRLAEDIAQLGKEQGLPYETALKLIAQTFVGAGKMLLHGTKSPKELIADVSSPNGTTLAGLNYFDTTTIDQEIKEVFNKAIVRSKELANEVK
ncbi:MAG: pyrroline-5-carboxylate reductase [Candidatus Margulisiibacteriota bacterium]|jgi:pyrroline-5-carboxylate reductase